MDRRIGPAVPLAVLIQILKRLASIGNVSQVADPRLGSLHLLDAIRPLRSRDDLQLSQVPLGGPVRANRILLGIAVYKTKGVALGFLSALDEISMDCSAEG